MFACAIAIVMTIDSQGIDERKFFVSSLNAEIAGHRDTQTRYASEDNLWWLIYAIVIPQKFINYYLIVLSDTTSC